jgi:N-dimethylarginine dimethylaminohydrolase
VREIPSQLPFPVLVLCPPTYVDTKVHNNAWMDEKVSGDLTLNKEKFTGEWYNLYQLLTANALVYLIPPKKGLQDQTYVNSFVYLKDDIIISSNFYAKGRAGEEIEAGKLLTSLGYKVIQSPHYFEGYPELKYSGKNNTFYGGYGIRSSIKTHQWLEREFDIKVIKLKETDKFLYHLDCSLFILNRDNVMMCTEVFTKKELKAIEKIATIHSVSIEAAYQGVCNSIKLGDFVINASSLDYMKESDKWYKEEVKKNEELEKICDKVGVELVYVSLSEAMKSGALCSCFMAPLNYPDLLY